MVADCSNKVAKEKPRPRFIPDDQVGLISRRQLRDRMDNLVRALKNGHTIRDAELHGLHAAAIHWSVSEHYAGPILRFSDILRRVKGIKAQEVFLAAGRRHIKTKKLELTYSDVLTEGGSFQQALTALRPFLTSPGAEPDLLVKAAKLNVRFGNWADAISLFKQALQSGPPFIDCRADLIQALIANGDDAEAVDIASTSFEDPGACPDLLLACYNAYLSFPVCDATLIRIRSLATSKATALNSTSAWWAQLYKAEKQFDRAIQAMTESIAIAPEHDRLLRERAQLAIRSGNWGRYVSEIRAAKNVVAAGSPLKARIAVVEDFLSAFGSERNTETGLPDLNRLATPESIFRSISESPKVPACRSEIKLVMIAWSLGPGGAERIFATLVRHLGRTSIPSLKLYLLDLDPQSRADFYLPFTGMKPDSVVVLNRNCEVETPFRFLPPEHGKTTQAIVNQLRLDRPHAIYVTLEPLTVFGALAGLSEGIGSILLHSHNMAPNILNPRADNLDHLQACYRIVLAQNGVFLLTCANAAANSYVDWLGDDYSTKILSVHNGLDFSEIGHTPPGLRAALRSELGIGSAQFVVGTAFSFREEKQPFLWIDAAERISLNRPESRFVMFGEGRFWEATKKYAERKAFGERVIFPGLVTDLYRRLPILDLFMLSSRSEALPNVLVEAQASSVPVIAFDVGGVSETMIPGTTGLLAGEMTADALAEKALAAMADKAWLDRAATMGPAFVRARFDMETMFQRFSTLTRQFQ